VDSSARYHSPPALRIPHHSLQILRDICAETVRVLLEKEQLILLGTAHTTDRRQYLTYLLDLTPSTSLPPPLLRSRHTVVINVSSFALSLLLSAFAQHSLSRPAAPTNGKITTPVFMHLLSCLSSFATCLGLSREGVKGSVSEEKVAKKSVEKSLAQLETALRSKHLRALFRT
jgi:hypothetical protein